jgi:hypothetical protein
MSEELFGAEWTEKDGPGGSHTWVNDGDEGIVCNDCDCKRGSRTSLRPCPATYVPGPTAEQVRDEQVARETVRPKSECSHCEPPEQP